MPPYSANNRRFQQAIVIDHLQRSGGNPPAAHGISTVAIPGGSCIIKAEDYPHFTPKERRNMKTVIVYYSLGGNADYAAKRLANILGAELLRL